MNGFNGFDIYDIQEEVCAEHEYINSLSDYQLKKANLQIIASKQYKPSKYTDMIRSIVSGGKEITKKQRIALECHLKNNMRLWEC